MKAINGEAMSAQEKEADICPVTQEDHQIASNSVSSSPEVQHFSLAIKPKGTPLFKLSALYKSRLKFCIFLHFVLFLVMLIKLSEDILDRMDIFILELEELYVPKPLIWEYLWAAGILLAVMALRALSKNRIGTLNSYIIGTMLLEVLPLLGAAVYFFSDITEYADKKGEAQVEKWQGFPVAVYWYGFIMVALQIHIFSVFFALKLVKIWRVKAKRF